ncbi:hypothetical protein QN277_017514 [Acacia crassicarpa]|uniref:Mitogen-activated protein kinase kinase kinase 1 n=1 Tax=Acacia crassicarpa TaxID=499986 RepID=A0AAE1KGA0_9FABA|nr:hypothetical protein QN277_017514 [Acacia crassicarpa]
MDSVPPDPSFSGRILRALRHPLLLLHRSHSSFFILGATGNVYTVTLSSLPSCTCPDRITPCKHILFVLIRVLGLPLDHFCLRRRTIRSSQLRRLLDLPTSPDALAGSALRERFHQLFFTERQEPSIEVEDGTLCPICMEEMGKEDKVVACGTCRNPIHEECLMRWKRSRGRRMTICVICRARWRGLNDQDQYLNLSAYISQVDIAETSSAGPCAG